MDVKFSKNAWDDYQYWQQKNRKISQEIDKLIKIIQRTPFEGRGNPEPLKHELSGWWSRRINQEHRVVYRISDNAIEIIQLRLHY